MELDTWQNLPAMFFEQADALGDRPFLYRKVDGAYRSITWRETADRVCRLADGLKARGIGPGDRVGLVSENRPEWLIADMAIMSIGAITVPAYTTYTVADHRHVFADSGISALLVSTDRLAQTAAAAAAETESVKFLATVEDAVIPADGNFDVTTVDALMADGDASLRLNGLIGGVGEGDRETEGWVPEVRRLVAEELDLPERGATIPTEKLIDPVTAAHWCDRTWMRQETEQPQHSVLLASRGEWRRVLRRFRSCHLATAIPLSKVARGSRGEFLRSGAFGVSKASGRTRLRGGKATRNGGIISDLRKLKKVSVATLLA